MPDGAFVLLVFGPALVGVTALLVGIRILSKPKRGKPNTTGENVFGVLLLLLAFGIGTCYAIMLFSTVMGR